MSRLVPARLAHLLLVVAGLLAIAYPFTLGAATTPTCRGAVMTPGSLCLKADGSQGQTYEQRQATRRSARPVIVGVGVLVSVFGVTLLVSDRRRRPSAPGSPVEHAG